MENRKNSAYLSSDYFCICWMESDPKTKFIKDIIKQCIPDILVQPECCRMISSTN